MNILDAARNPAGLRHGLARLGLAAADEPPRAAGRRDGAQQLHRVQLPGRRRRQAAAPRRPSRSTPTASSSPTTSATSRSSPCAPRPSELAPFGFNPLIEAEGKAIIGEYVTIVQHPRGEKKQIALRENKIVDMPDRFMHYAADTEPGSSGSPVFNDQWEVVALHHASVVAPDHAELGGFLNEGIRVSRILQFVKEQALSPGHARARRRAVRRARGGAAPRPAARAARRAARRGRAPAAAAAPGGEVTITVPVEITVRVGDADRRGAAGAGGRRARGDLDRPRLLQPRGLRRRLPRPAAAAARARPGARRRRRRASCATTTSAW